MKFTVTHLHKSLLTNSYLPFEWFSEQGQRPPLTINKTVNVFQRNILLIALFALAWLQRQTDAVAVLFPPPRGTAAYLAGRNLKTF